MTLLGIDLPDGSTAVDHVARHFGAAEAYGLALVDLDVWHRLNAAGTRVINAERGPVVPGAGHLRTRDLTAHNIPADHHGIPPAHDGSQVRWWEPPHPLSLTADECAAAISAAGDLHQGAHAHLGTLPAHTTVDVYDRIEAALAVGSVLAWPAPSRFATVTVLHYLEGDGIRWHTDAAAYATREAEMVGGFVLSAIVQLSPPGAYTGGAVQFRTTQGVLELPRTQGTVAVFPAATWHRVTPLQSGERWALTAFCQADGA